jgi:hypothetical protein
VVEDTASFWQSSRAGGFQKSELNAIAMEKDRLWVAGDDAFLAYSIDGRRCWVALDYYVRQGAEIRSGFNEPAKNPCPAGASTVSTSSRLFSRTTIVFAAAEAAQNPASQSKAPGGRDFTDALSIWHPLVLSRQETPRAAKRFVNRVRFLAMRQGPSRDSATPWERTLFPDRLRTPKGVEFKRIPEELLVALAAIEQAAPDWIYGGVAFNQMVRGEVSGPKTKFTELFVDARNAHLQRYKADDAGNLNDGDWKNITTYRDRFLEIWPQLTVR